MKLLLGEESPQSCPGSSQANFPMGGSKLSLNDKFRNNIDRDQEATLLLTQFPE